MTQTPEGGSDHGIRDTLVVAYSKLTGTREEFTILVKAAGHDSIGGIKGLLDPVSMMNIDIDIQDALVISFVN